MNAESAEMLQKMIDDSSRIVFFGGAGVSTESGIPDFRSRGGLFSQKYKYPPRRILSKTFYRSKPEEFYRFYRDRMVWPDAKPNLAHRKLAELEAAGKLSAIVTQNIDGLHQAAGSRKVLEVHGSIHRNYCQKCGKFYDLDYMLHTEGVPVCGCGGVIKPDVVLYEEKLNQKVMAEAAEYLSKADMLIIGGTSLSVYPASRLIRNYGSACSGREYHRCAQPDHGSSGIGAVKASGSRVNSPGVSERQREQRLCRVSGSRMMRP